MSAERTRVVVVGAGMAGAAAALRIRERMGDAVDIVVLEAGEAVGGRAHRTPFAGEILEVGGTLLHSSNTYLVGIMERLGIDRAHSAESVPNPKASLGVWDGERFALRVPTGDWRFLAGIVARYRLRSLRRMSAAAKDALVRVQTIYPALEAGRTFASPAELAEFAGLAELSRSSLVDMLTRRGVSRRTIAEIGGGVLHNMFNQETYMAGFPGLVGLIGAGLAGGELFSVDGGNQRLVEGSLRLAGADVRTGARVSRVRDDRTVELADGSTVAADVVVLAVPLAVAGIDLPTAVELPPTRYRHVHVTLVAGRLSERYFGMSNPPETVFTASGENRPFNSAARIGWSRSMGVPIFKFFGTRPLPDDTVHRIVDDVRDIKRIEWDAYPLMEVAPQTAPFEISPAIFFPNAFEPVISTLETQSVAGRVVGDLVAQRLEAAGDTADVSTTA